MKKRSFLLFFILAVVLCSYKSRAQDVCSSNPKYCKLLNDTAGIKMMVITLPPGARLVTHTHPVNIGYVLQGGLYKWTYNTGQTETANMKKGDHFQGGPETPHYSWNAGNTTLQFILIEKEAG